MNNNINNQQRFPATPLFSLSYGLFSQPDTRHTVPAAGAQIQQLHNINNQRQPVYVNYNQPSQSSAPHFQGVWNNQIYPYSYGSTQHFNNMFLQVSPNNPTMMLPAVSVPGEQSTTISTIQPAFVGQSLSTVNMANTLNAAYVSTTLVTQAQPVAQATAGTTVIGKNQSNRLHQMAQSRSVQGVGSPVVTAQVSSANTVSNLVPPQKTSGSKIYPFGTSNVKQQNQPVSSVTAQVQPFPAIHVLPVVSNQPSHTVHAVTTSTHLESKTPHIPSIGGMSRSMQRIRDCATVYSTAQSFPNVSSVISGTTSSYISTSTVNTMQTFAATNKQSAKQINRSSTSESYIPKSRKKITYTMEQLTGSEPIVIEPIDDYTDDEDETGNCMDMTVSTTGASPVAALTPVSQQECSPVSPEIRNKISDPQSNTESVASLSESSAVQHEIGNGVQSRNVDASLINRFQQSSLKSLTAAVESVVQERRKKADNISSVQEAEGVQESGTSAPEFILPQVSQETGILQSIRKVLSECEHKEVRHSDMAVNKTNDKSTTSAKPETSGADMAYNKTDEKLKASSKSETFAVSMSKQKMGNVNDKSKPKPTILRRGRGGRVAGGSWKNNIKPVRIAPVPSTPGRFLILSNPGEKSTHSMLPPEEAKTQRSDEDSGSKENSTVGMSTTRNDDIAPIHSIETENIPAASGGRTLSTSSSSSSPIPSALQDLLHHRVVIPTPVLSDSEETKEAQTVDVSNNAKELLAYRLPLSKIQTNEKDAEKSESMTTNKLPNNNSEEVHDDIIGISRDQKDDKKENEFDKELELPKLCGGKRRSKNVRSCTKNNDSNTSDTPLGKKQAKKLNKSLAVSLDKIDHILEGRKSIKEKDFLQKKLKRVLQNDMPQDRRHIRSGLLQHSRRATRQTDSFGDLLSGEGSNENKKSKPKARDRHGRRTGNRIVYYESSSEDDIQVQVESKLRKRKRVVYYETDEEEESQDIKDKKAFWPERDQIFADSRETFQAENLQGELKKENDHTCEAAENIAATKKVVTSVRQEEARSNLVAAIEKQKAYAEGFKAGVNTCTSTRNQLSKCGTAKKNTKKNVGALWNKSKALYRRQNRVPFRQSVAPVAVTTVATNTSSESHSVMLSPVSTQPVPTVQTVPQNVTYIINNMNRPLQQQSWIPNVPVQVIQQPQAVSVIQTQQVVPVVQNVLYSPRKD